MTAPDRERTRPLVRTSRKGRPDPRTPTGNAPYASRRPGVRDRVLAAAVLPGVAAMWQVMGLRMSAATLRHYLAATGEPLLLDPVGPLSTAPFRRVADRHLEEWRTIALARWQAGGGADDDFDVTTNWHGVRVRRDDDLDWWLALRGLQYRMTGRLKVRPGVNPEWPAVHVRYRVEIFKDWNFDKDKLEYGMTFTPLARLHEVGLAREYVVVGRTGDLNWHAD